MFSSLHLSPSCCLFTRLVSLSIHHTPTFKALSKGDGLRIEALLSDTVTIMPTVHHYLWSTHLAASLLQHHKSRKQLITADWPVCGWKRERRERERSEEKKDKEDGAWEQVRGRQRGRDGELRSSDTTQKRAEQASVSVSGPHITQQAVISSTPAPSDHSCSAWQL